MLKMAFRNLARNKKRTFFTMLSVVLGVAGIIFGVGYIRGIADMAKQETIRITGDIRIVDTDFEFKSKILDISSNVPFNEIKEKLKSVDGIKDIQPKIKFGAYVFSGDKDEPALGLGTEENDYVTQRIYKGRYFDINSEGETVVGSKLQKRMDLKLGDEITVLVSTQHGSIFALNYKVVGFYDINPALNKGFYISLHDAMYLLDMEDTSTELQIFLEDSKTFKEKKKEIQGILDEKKYVAESWDEIGIAAAMGIYVVMEYIIAAILGLLAGVGILNTMVMAVYERKKEIGVIKAMGMENKDIVKLITLEGTLIGLLGSLGGILIGSFATLYYTKVGIYTGAALDSIGTGGVEFGDRLYPKLTFEAIILALATGLIVAFIASYMPARRETKKEAVENLSDFGM